MLTIESFPVGDMTLIRAPASGAVAVVDRQARTILEGLVAGCDEAELARRLADAAGGLDQAALQIAALRRAWLGLASATTGTASPDDTPGENDAPALDAICNAGERPVRLRVWPRGLARTLAAVTGPSHAQECQDDAAAEITVRRTRGRYGLQVEGVGALVTRDPMLARSEALRHLVLAAHPHRRWLAMLHAAGVAGPEGAALLCGASGAGKSTLTAMLLASGLALVTDDYAPIEAGTGALWPVRLGLSVKEGSWPLLAADFPGLAAAPLIRTRQRRQRYIAPPQWAQGPVPVRCLVFPLYGSGEPLELIRLEPGEALALVARSGGWYESSPDRLAELTDWIAGLPAYALGYGDGTEAVAVVRELLLAGP